MTCRPSTLECSPGSPVTVQRCDGTCMAACSILGGRERASTPHLYRQEWARLARRAWAVCRLLVSIHPNKTGLADNCQASSMDGFHVTGWAGNTAAWGVARERHISRPPTIRYTPATTTSFRCVTGHNSGTTGTSQLDRLPHMGGRPAISIYVTTRDMPSANLPPWFLIRLQDELQG